MGTTLALVGWAGFVFVAAKAEREAAAKLQ